MKPVPVDRADLDRLVDGAHHDPHSILGAHPFEGNVTIRVLRPGARAVTVVLPNTDDAPTRVPMDHEARGVWFAVVPASEVPDYRIDVQYDADPIPSDDPYRFWPLLGELDMHLLGEGRHEELWHHLGAHVRRSTASSAQSTGRRLACGHPTR